MNNVIQEVVQNDLCSGCGVCAGVCPTNSLSMAESPNGDLTPRWTQDPCTSQCGLCFAVCAFADGVFDPRPLNEELYGPKAGHAGALFHEDVGYFDSSFVGYSDVHRPASASGGLLTWTLETLLSSGEVDRVAIVVCAAKEGRGYSFVFREVRTVEEVRQGAGSIYHQVELSDVLRRVASEPTHRWAVTGVPCLCAALRQAARYSPKIGQSIRYVLGLACGMYQNRFYTEMLLARSGLDYRDVSSIEYRRKSLGAPPNDFRFRGTDNRGRIGNEIAYSGLPIFLGRNAFFRINACNFCRDVFAETADACYMDAWLPEYRKESRGTSLVLVRNPKIRNMFFAARESQSLSLNEIGIERIVASQKGHVRRKRYLIKMRQGRNSHDSHEHAFSFDERLDWFIQQRAQRRSKTLWPTVGRRFGSSAFWLLMFDVLIMMGIKQFYSKSLGRVFRYIARTKKAKEISV